MRTLTIEELFVVASGRGRRRNCARVPPVCPPPPVPECGGSVPPAPAPAPTPAPPPPRADT